MTRGLFIVRLVLGAVTDLVGEVLSPHACAACDGPAPRRTVFCPACAGTVVRAPPAGGREPIAFADFGGAVAVALRRLKYSGRPDLARPLGELARAAARSAGAATDLVVPVPLHPRRLADRGYNQACLLARAVAAEVSASLEPRALVRVRHTPQQAHLDRRARLDNVRGAFRAPRSLAGRRVLLVDDVSTTGATLAACASALRDAAALEVTALVVARATA